MKYDYEALKAQPDEYFYNNPPMPGDCFEKATMYPIEVARRQRIHQVELDKMLIKKQTNMMIYAAIIGVVATLAGVCLGSYLNNKFQAEPAIHKLRQQLEQQIQKEISALRAEQKLYKSPVSK